MCSRLNGVAGCIMPEYRCNMLNQHGDILFPSDIVAESLDAALQDAVDVFRKCNEGSSTSRQAYAFEVWSGSTRLFPEPLAARQERVAAK